MIEQHSPTHESYYRESPPALDLSSHIQCTWHRRVGRNEATRPVRVVPDGCMDLMWMQGKLMVAGPDTTVWESRHPQGAEIVGLRFHPGAASTLLGVPASELVNGRILARAVTGRWVDEISSRLESAQNGQATAGILQDAVRTRLAHTPEPDPLVGYVVRSIRQSPPDEPIRVRHLADRAGVSERQLHRRCSAALGYGAKTFARIVRFQHFLTHAKAASMDTLALIAVETGYTDQSHLTREVRRLSGLSPTELIVDPPPS